jgi:hypothetical protein
MVVYRVCFDGKWQGKFADREDALDWARKVGETGRITHVVHFGYLLRWIVGPRLVAVFPESQAAEGRRLWKRRHAGSHNWGA